MLINNADFFLFQIGRGMRQSTDKEDCLIMDFVDSFDRVEGVVSIPNLFGLDPSEIDVNG
jgi:ATP-dependent helicase IRC3